MNSTGSFQPRCLNRTTVKSPSGRSSKLTFVPIHSSGPSTTCQSTRRAGSSSRTFMSKPPTSPKRKRIVPPAFGSPWVVLVHQPARPSSVVNALYVSLGFVLMSTLCRISGMAVLLGMCFGSARRSMRGAWLLQVVPGRRRVRVTSASGFRGDSRDGPRRVGLVAMNWREGPGVWDKQGNVASELSRLLSGFRGRKLVVVGDLVADNYVYGQTDRVSREAPVLVVRHESSEVTLGGAANAAANARALGAEVTTVGVLGRDEMGEAVRQRFAE